VLYNACCLLDIVQTINFYRLMLLQSTAFCLLVSTDAATVGVLTPQKIQIGCLVYRMTFKLRNW